MGLLASHSCQPFLPAHTQGCCHGPFPVPLLSFSATFLGSGCQAWLFPTLKGF